MISSIVWDGFLRVVSLQEKNVESKVIDNFHSLTYAYFMTYIRYPLTIGKQPRGYQKTLYLA